MKRTEYFTLRKEYLDEIATYKQRLGWYADNETLVAHYNYLLRETQSRLEALEGIGYDDNDVYRTGERQLDTRIDGSTERRLSYALTTSLYTQML